MKTLHKLLIGILGIAILGVLIYGISFFNGTSTGHVALNLDSNYMEGQPLNGTLDFSVQEGELIPSSAKIVFENGNNTYEYLLSDVVSDSALEGSFYVEGKSISGNGEGFGIEGEKIIYPVVYFTLNIVSSSSSSEENETPSENLTNIENATTEENVPVEEVNASSTEEAVSSTETTTSEDTNAESSSVIEESSDSATNTEETSSETETASETAPITGNAVAGFSKGVFNSFLRFVGFASLSINNQIEGQVSKGNDFVYNLGDGETAEIASGSVRTDLGVIADSEISLQIQENQAIVATDYSETENGFGSEYIGDEEKTFSIDLSKIGFVPQQGELKISLSYEGTSIVSISTEISSEGEVTAQNETQIIGQNVTSLNETNVTSLNNTIINVTIAQNNYLTDEERKTLLDEFGNSSVQVTKAEETSSNYVVRFELGDYWVEHSYSLKISEDELADQVESDRILFLKDLAKEIMKQNEETKQIENILGSYEI